jgi:hypothetical protein
MSISLGLGGLGIMSLRNPLGEWAGFVYAKGDIRSVFCLVVFSIVFLVLGQSFFSLGRSMSGRFSLGWSRAHVDAISDGVRPWRAV